jgi:aspartate kinase
MTTNIQTTVHKFGGFAMSTAHTIKAAAEIVLSCPNRNIIVVSAPGTSPEQPEKVTALLISLWEKAHAGESTNTLSLVITDIYTSIIQNLGLNSDEFEIVDELGYLTDRPTILSRGEYLMAKIFVEYLKMRGLPNASFIEATDIIFFKEDGDVDTSKVTEAAARLITSEGPYVIPGFYGHGNNGAIQLFPRNGSDISATQIAAAVNATECILWKDTDGILMANPKDVLNPPVIPCLTPNEVRQLTYMGSAIVHTEAIEPLVEDKIPLRIKNLLRPEKPGTRVVYDRAHSKRRGLVGLASKNGFIKILVRHRRMNETPGWGDKILKVIADHGLSFEHVTTDIDVFEVTLHTGGNDNATRSKIKNTILAAADTIRQQWKPDTLEIRDDISLIAVVGNCDGGKAISEIYNLGIPIELVTYTGNGGTLIIGVPTLNLKKSTQKILSVLA